jgi:hypothetical protein
MSRRERAERDLARRAAAKVEAPELELAGALAREHDRPTVRSKRRVEIHPNVVGEPT